MASCLLIVGCRTEPASSESEKEQTASRSGSTGRPNTAPPRTSSPLILFEQVPPEAGLSFVNRNGEEAQQFSILESLGGGVGMIDFDLDGDDDVVLPGGGRMDSEAQPTGLPCGLFRNTGSFNFSDTTVESNVANEDLYSHGIATGDFDGDGFPDFLVTGFGLPQLFHNQGDGTFLQTMASASPGNSQWSSSAAWGDVNGDGYLDIYIARYVNWTPNNNPRCDGPNDLQDVCPPRDFEGLNDSLYLSNGDGTFSDATTACGIQPGGKGLGVILADLDADSDVDIYVTNDTVPNHLFQNDGSGRLVDMSLVSGGSVSGTGVPQGSMGTQLMDFNSDGRFDIWVTNYEKESSALYEGLGNFLFRHVSQRTKLTDVGAMFVGWGVLSFDMDHDGDEDVLVSNGHVIRYPQAAPLRQTALLMENVDGSRFKNVTPTGGGYVSTPHMARGSASSDLDLDGDLDVVVMHTNEPVAVLQNATKAANWLSINLFGVNSSRDPTGATVTIKTGKLTLHRQFIGGGSYASSNARKLHCGLGNSSVVEKLTVVWPSGRMQSFEQLDTNQTIHVVEGSGYFTTID